MTTSANHPMFRFKLSSFLLLITLITSSCFPVEKEKEETQKRQPNIVILFCDDMGYGDIGSYGHPTIHTPNLDRMVQEGMKFTQFYSGSPACTASRYALLTGRYPVRSGFSWVLYPESPRGIHPNEFTIAEGLKEAGYATAAFGKWHLGSTDKAFWPLQNGFDQYIGLPYSNDMLPPKWPDIALLQDNDTLEMNPDQSTLTKLYTEKGQEFILSHREDPFFLYIPYAMPHIPLHPGKDFANTSRRGLYGDVIEEIDWSVGQIMKTLKEEGLSENTLVFFTSDNGPWIIKDELGGSAGLLRDGKGSTWEGGMRVPGIAWWPGTISPNTIQPEPGSTLDLLPTTLALANTALPTSTRIDGRDLTKLFKQDTRPEQPYFFYGPNELHAVRMGPWKLHIKTSSQTGQQYFGEKSPLLFNLDTDPSEKYELSEQFPAMVDSLMQIIQTHKSEIEQSGNYWQTQ